MKIKINYSPTLNEIEELDLALATTPKGECIIGRSPDSDMVLDSPDVSRVHGKFFLQSGNYYFCDLGSRNGSIINGKIAEKNVPFLLKDKDIIRIGDYVMSVEDIIPVSQQLPETVFRTIDPAIFSRRFSNENVGNPAPEVVSEVPQPPTSESAGELSQPQSEVEPSELEDAINALESTLETPEETNEQEADAGTPVVAEEVTFVQPEYSVTPVPEVVSEVSIVVNDESVATPTAEEVTLIQPEDSVTPTPEVVSEVSIVVNDESAATPTAEVVSEIPADINQQDIDLDAEISREFTIVQPRDIVIQPPQVVSEFTAEINEQNIDADEENLQDFTNVQPRDILRQPPEAVGEIPPDVAEILQDFTILQMRNVETQPLEDVSEISEPLINQDSADEFRVDIAAVEAPEFVDNFTPEFSNEDSTFTEDVIIVSGYVVSGPSDLVSEVPQTNHDDATIVETPPEIISEVSESPDISNQEVNLTAINPEEVSAEIRNLETSQDIGFVSPTANEVSEPTNIESLETTAEVPVISNTETEEIEDEIMPELISNQTSESISQTLDEIFGTEKTLSDEIAQEVPVSEPQQMINQKNIVLIAHDSKKSELADFVNQHQEFFSKSLTVAWPSISEVLTQEAGITVSQQIPAATSGGYQTINSLVNSGDVVAVIFLVDFIVRLTTNEETFLRSCNINQVLVATNLPTAEAIVHYLKNV